MHTYQHQRQSTDCATTPTHLLHGVVAGGERGAHGVADLVVRHQALRLAVHHGRALHARHNAVHRLVDLL